MLEEPNDLDALYFNEIAHFVHDEIQTSLDEIKAFGFDEIKSVFYSCETRFHHEVISFA